MAEHELDPFAVAARELLDARLSEHAPLLDVEDVVERAHDLDPEHVPAAALERAREIPLTPAAEEALSAAEADALERFNADARALLDAELAPRDLAAVVPPRARALRRRPRWTWAAAAVVLLVAGGAIAGIATLRGGSGRGGSGEPAVQAEHTARSVPTVETTTDRASARTHAAEIEGEPPRPPSPAPTPEEGATEDDPTGDDATEDQAPAQPHRNEPDPRALADRLAELDALAQSQWKSGDREAAQKTFEKIVKLGGRTPYAEQAYGELFALAHQLHGEARQVKLWRGYLRRFPRGRYADAARSGLCRASEEKAKRQCWTRYLQKHPKGAARAEALRETGE